jgi:hypothetical protein
LLLFSSLIVSRLSTSVKFKDISSLFFAYLL